MNITRQFAHVSRKFIAVIILVSIVSVAALSLAIYQANSSQIDNSISSGELHSVVEGNEAVVSYLEEEKDFEAHFITIANLVKDDQRSSITRAIVYTTIPIVLAAGVLGYMAARYLLRPVRESYESQERFMQDAAHELRNPLAAMSLSIENAQSSTTDSQLLSTMKRQTNRLIRINEDMLYLERRTPGATIKDVNISELTEDILEDLRPSITHKKLRIKAHIEPNIMKKIDTKDYIKLAGNIIENAIKYSKKNTTITVGLRTGKSVELIVKDQGIGIPKQDIPHIGQRFYRSKNTGNIHGTGLGIAIVHKVLNVYGGTLTVDSTINKGTTITVSM